MSDRSQEKTFVLDPALSQQFERIPFRLLLAATFVFFSVFAWVFLRDVAVSEWTTVYVRAAERMVRCEKINLLEQGCNPYAYPPAMAMMTVPLTVMPPFWGMACWYLINVVATVAICVYAWRLCGAPTLRGASCLGWGVFLLGILLGSRFLIAPLTHQQFDAVIAALILGGCWLLFCGRSIRGALLIGVAASMKCTPLLFVPYLIWRRQTRSALIVALLAVGLNVMPDFCFPKSDGRWYLQDWLELCFGAGATGTTGTWFADPMQNQSLSGMIGRWTQFGLPLHIPSGPKAWWPAESRVLAPSLFWCGTFALLALTLWFCRRPFQSWTSGSAGIPLCNRGDAGPYSPLAAAQSEATAWNPALGLPLHRLRFSLEAAIVVTLMLLLSPMSGKAHFVVMLLPCFLAARLALENPARGMRWLFVPLLLFGPLLSKDLIGKSMADISLYWSTPTWFLLVALAWLLWAITLVDRCPKRDQ